MVAVVNSPGVARLGWPPARIEVVSCDLSLAASTIVRVLAALRHQD
jgi:hypothetical protein